MSTTRFTLPSFAKINLYLRIHGRRADNYHEISTVFQTVTLHDTLAFDLLADGRLELTCNAADVPADESNLVIRAAKLLRTRFQLRDGARLELDKRIPAGGGLGGGSSNAAIALIGLSHLWQIKTNKHALTEIAAQLGADVPFFLTGGRALGTGLGTEIEPLLDVATKYLLIITPNVKVSTAEAYKSLNAPALTKANQPVNLPISRMKAEFSDSHHAGLANDFEPSIFRLYPEIERARDSLLSANARATLLSGSGSSVYGIFDSQRECERGQSVLRTEAGWRVFNCATLAHADYWKKLGAGAVSL